jgi:hypothetical protein
MLPPADDGHQFPVIYARSLRASAGSGARSPCACAARVCTLYMGGRRATTALLVGGGGDADLIRGCIAARLDNDCVAELDYQTPSLHSQGPRPAMILPSHIADHRRPRGGAALVSARWRRQASRDSSAPGVLSATQPSGGGSRGRSDAAAVSARRGPRGLPGPEQQRDGSNSRPATTASAAVAHSC